MVAKSYKYQVAFLIALVSFLVLTFLPFLAEKQILGSLLRKQGVFENLTVGYLLVASLLLFLSFLRLRRKSWFLRLSYILLAFLLLLVAGQAMNWGQRLLEWDVNQYIGQVEGRTAVSLQRIGDLAGAVSLPEIKFSQFLMSFVITFALVIPLSGKLLPKFGKSLAAVIPVLPLGAGILVVAAIVMSKWGRGLLPLAQLPSLSDLQADEISNHAYALALMVSVIFHFMIKLDEKKKEDDEMLLRELTYYRR